MDFAEKEEFGLMEWSVLLVMIYYMEERNPRGGGLDLFSPCIAKTKTISNANEETLTLTA